MYWDCIAHDKHIVVHCIGIALLMISIIVHCNKNTYAMHWNEIGDDKHSCAMFWD